MKVAVVGAGGFIGSRLVESLVLQGRGPVIPIARRASGLALAMRFDLDGRVANGFDEEALASAMRDCEVVVHAIAGDPATIVGSVEPVYRAAERAGCRRLIYLSSASVHGQDPPAGVTEETPLSDRQYLPYNNAKVQAERLLGRLRQAGRVETVILRPGIVYGPRSYWIGGFADQLLSGEAYLVGGGQGVCNAHYVDNLVHAIQLACHAPGADGRVYLLGDSDEVTWADFCRPVVEALGFSMEDVPRPPLAAAGGKGEPLALWLRRSKAAEILKRHLPVPLRQAGGAFVRAMSEDAEASKEGRPILKVKEEIVRLHTAKYRPAWSRAARELGYTPQVSLKEGMRRSIAWLAFAGYEVMQHGEPDPRR